MSEFFRMLAFVAVTFLQSVGAVCGFFPTLFLLSALIAWILPGGNSSKSGDINIVINQGD